jgi:ABC-type multidrug transport system fused ATPase/permease subunit
MDRIVVVSAGRIAEDGTHDELLDAQGWYQRSWEATLAAQGPSGSRYNGI